MVNFVALDFADHRLLRLSTVYNAAQGDGLGMVSVVPTEIPALVNSYPLFFRKSPGDGHYELGAMLGFAPDENLFLDSAKDTATDTTAGHGGWDAGYVPLTLRREPFAVRQSTTALGSNTLMIDLDSPRLSDAGGDVLFFSDGRPSERLQAVIDVLEALVKGAALGQAYAAALAALDLIEPVELRVDLGGGVTPQLTGLYTIADSRLADVSASVLRDLQQQGFLPWIYQQAASVGQISNLIVRKARMAHRHGA